MLTLGLAGLGAGRCNCRINDLGMSLGGNHFLCLNDRVADRAVLAFGQASLGAGCLNSRVNDFGMARRRDLFHTGYRSAADRALRAGFMASLGAGSGLFRNFNRSMSSRVDCFGLGCIANCAGVGLDANVLTGRRGRDLALIPVVALGGNLSLCNENFVADGAVLAFRLAWLRASRLDHRINHFRVTLRGNSFLRGNHLTAGVAVLTFGQSSLRAGWGLCCIDYFCVAGCRDLFHTGEDCLTNGALRAGFMASLGAGSGLLSDVDRGMPGRVNRFCLSFFANRAGVGLDANILTGRRGRDLALIPAVALGWNLCLCFDNRSADRAADAIRQTRFGAGRRLARNGLLSVAGRGDLFHTGENRLTNGALRTGFMTSLGAGSGLFRNFNRSMSSRVDCFGLGCIANCAGVGLGTGVLTGSGGGNHALIPAVALCRNGFTRLLYFITNLAIGIAGVAFLSAGRLTATTNLGQRVVILPAGFEGQVGEGEEHFIVPFLVMKLIRLESIVANSSGDEPTGEVIAFASKATFGKRVILAGPAVDDFYRIHRADAAVGIKSDGELLKFVEYCPEVNVLMRVEAPAVDSLRLIIGSPAHRKDVGIVLILGSARGFVVRIIPSSRILAGVVALLQDCVVPVQPADMVLVQRPLGVEGDIFVGGDVCLVAIGRAGAVLRRVPTGEIIVRAGEGVGGQGSRLIGLHGLRTHGSLAAVGVKGDDRVLSPLGIKGGILAEFHGRLVGIGRASTVCRSVPAGEGVAFAGKGVLWQIKTRIGLTCPGRHRSFAAVGVKVNSDVRSTAPYAIQIGNGRTRAGICRLGVGAVCVV